MTLSITSYSDDALIFLAGFVSLIFSILWLIIGWRAMKAHEKLADTARLSYVYSKRKDLNKEPMLQTVEDIKEHDRYEDFIREDPERAFLYQEDVSEVYTEWLERNPKS